MDDLRHRARLHARGRGDFLGHRKTRQPNPAGSGHWNFVRGRGGRRRLAAEPRGRRRRRNPLEVWKCFALFVAVGLLHFVLRKPFLLVSFNRERAYEQGYRVRWWDFLFYAAFGLVVTSFVRIAGVLLVFSYLIVPAVCGINLAKRISHRLLIGWVIAWLGGIAGLFLSFWWDLPSGAAIVCTFGALLVAISFVGLWRRRAQL